MMTRQISGVLERSVFTLARSFLIACKTKSSLTSIHHQVWGRGGGQELQKLVIFCIAILRWGLKINIKSIKVRGRSQKRVICIHALDNGDNSG